jgi:hypothetical protein
MNDKPDGKDHFYMNAYQKAATLVLRLVGSALAAIGAIGPIAIAATKAIGQDSPSSGRWAGSAMWFIGGILLILLSKTLGRMLGSGLD